MKLFSRGKKEDAGRLDRRSGGQIIGRPQFTYKPPPRISQHTETPTCHRNADTSLSLPSVANSHSFIQWVLCFPKPHELHFFQQPPINGSSLNALRRVGQEGPQALHHHQVQRKLDRRRARQVPRSSSTVSSLFILFVYFAYYVPFYLK